MPRELIEKAKSELERIVGFLGKEIAALRTGRATPALVEDIAVECYGSKTPLKHLAAIHVAGPREIQIQPWDAGILKNITDAIQQSPLGVNPAVERTNVRLNLPQLTEDRRRQLVKVLREKTEEARVAVRRERDDVLKKIEGLFREKKIGEDDKFRAKDEVQRLVDETNKKIEEAAKKKEGEILTL